MLGNIDEKLQESLHFLHKNWVSEIHLLMLPLQRLLFLERKLTI